MKRGALAVVIYFLLLFLLIILLSADSVYAHVCNDVVGGSQVGCPDPQTVEYVSSSSSGNRFTIISDVTAKHVQFIQNGCTCTGTEADGCYDNNDYGNICNTGTCYTSGFTVQYFDFDVNQGSSSYLSFSSSPSTPRTLSDKQTLRFSIYIDVNPSAPSQHYDISIGMKGSLSGTIRPIYRLQFDWEADGCSSNSDCSGTPSTPYCRISDGVCVECLNAGNCDDGNSCTSDSCSSNSCSNSNLADGCTCTSGFCCSGVCDTSTGNTGFHVDCRSGPSCVGTSWQYTVYHNGYLCGGFECRECSNGYCTSDDSTRCGAGEVCSSGTCVSSCTNECSSSGLRECSGNSYRVCGNYDGDSCLEWSSLTACSGGTPYCRVSDGVCVACLLASHCNDNNDCTTDTCSSNSCSNVNRADGSTCGTNGYCCGGACDTTTANTNYHADCRSGPSCVSSSWEYSIANNGNLCGGFACRECVSGLCTSDDDSRCGTGEVCTAGVCTSTGCIGDSDCSGTPSTPHCNTVNGQCVECLNAGQCDDSSECTTDSCSSNTCSNVNRADNSDCTTCQGSNCKCQSGSCTCIANCTGRQCGDDGCGGSCGTCSNYINESNGVCYDDATCTNGMCGFSANTLILSSDCCDQEFVIEDSDCVQQDIPNSTNCNADEFCTSSCSCVQNPCTAFTTENDCNVRSDCAWCSFTTTCLPDEQVECTDNAVCYDGNNYCRNDCRIILCTGISTSCGCTAGQCTTCAQDETCESNVCTPAVCTPDWSCIDWSACTPSGQQTRTCTDLNDCGSTANRPQISRTCTYIQTQETDTTTDVASDVRGDDQSELSTQQTDDQQTTSIEEQASDKKSPLVMIVLGIVIVIAVAALLVFLKLRKGGAGGISSMSYGGEERQPPPEMGGAQPQKQLTKEEMVLYNYIMTCLSKNYTPQQIRSVLVQKGWKPDMIDNMLRRFA